MPNVNIPASVRFALYILSAVGSVVATYLISVGRIGEAELAAWSGLVSIVTGIAASNTNLSGGVPVVVHDAVAEVADKDAVAELEAGQSDLVTALIVVILVVVLISLLGGLR